MTILCFELSFMFIAFDYLKERQDDPVALHQMLFCISNLSIRDDINKQFFCDEKLLFEEVVGLTKHPALVVSFEAAFVLANVINISHTETLEKIWVQHDRSQMCRVITHILNFALKHDR